MKKRMICEAVTEKGIMSRGKYTFENRVAFALKVYTDPENDSANRFQIMMPLK
jgi:hypothetical protein